MKKLMLVLISAGILTACGDSFRSIKVKDFVNLPIAEQEKYQDEIIKEVKSLQQSKAATFAMNIGFCSSSLIETTKREPEYCNKTMGEYLDSLKN